MSSSQLRYMLICSLATLTHAESQASRGIEQIVVTGTRTEKNLEESPISIDVITAPEIEMVSTGTVADALNYIPGVSVRTSQKDGFNVFMQGFDGDRVLVLVDGQALISPTGASVDLGQISALNIKQIEVLKGPASVLYGSAAMGGVINIITDKGGKDFLKLSYESGSYSGNAIEDEEYRQQANIIGSLFKPTWNGRLTFQRTENPGFEYDPEATEHDGGKVNKDFFQGSAQKKFSEYSIEIKTQYFTEDKYKITGPFPGAGDSFYQSDVEQTQYNIALRSQTGWHVLTRYNFHEELSGQRTGLRNTEIFNIDLDTQYTWQSKKVDWVMGAHYYQEGIDQRRITGTIEVNDEQRDGVEVFFQSDWYASNNWEVIAGIRAQNDSGYGGHSAARVNAMWQHSTGTNGDIKWRTTFGQGYRVPTLKERYFFFDHSNLGYQVLGSPDLEPETTLSLTTGLEFVTSFSSNNKVNAEISAHYSDARDFINTNSDPERSAEANLDISVYENIDEVEISGFDMSVSFITPRQKYQLNYAYVDARNALTDARLTQRPYHQVKANYWWFSPKKSMNTLLYVVYEKNEATGSRIRTADDYLTANFIFNINFSKRFSWKVGIENIFDDHQNPTIDREVFLDPRPIDSRYVFVGFSFQLD